MGTGVDRIIQLRGGDAPAKNQTGVQKIIELLGGDPPAKNQTGVDKIVEILENGGGGGNPNSVETVQGTLSWPFGMHGISLANDLYAMNASAWLDLDCTVLGLGIVRYPVVSDGGTTFKIFATSIYPDSAFDSEAHWDYIEDGGINWYLHYAYMLEIANGEYTITDMRDYKDILPTTLTIIWHPLPT